MIDWSKSMQQTFEYYVVDPDTWGDLERAENIKTCKVTRDLESETLGSATLDSDIDYTDKYIRVYLVAIQNGEKRKIPLGTHIYQTPSVTFDGRMQSMSQDGYTSLIELKEKVMPVGYAINASTSNPVDALKIATAYAGESVRAPVIEPSSDGQIIREAFLSEMADTRLSFLSDLLTLTNYRFGIDELGRIIFEPNQSLATMKPKFEFNDSNSSILAPSITMQRDLYGVPNVLEVAYSAADGNYLYAVAKNEDPNSIISIQSRGREVWYRETDPNIPTGATQSQLNEYAKYRLKQLSSIEYTVTYTHGYCDVTIGDCVRLNYERAGISGVNAKIIKQVISCESGCQVEETSVYSRDLVDDKQITVGGG